jgi:hypothetical protein
MVLNKEILDLPFLGNLHQDADPKVLQPGDFVDVVNAEFQITGAISKRPGFKESTTAGTDISASKIFYHNDTLLAAAPGDTVNPNGLFARVDHNGTWQKMGDIPDATVKRSYTVRDNTAQIQSADMTIAGNYKIYAWIQYVNEYSAPAMEKRVYCRIVDKDTDAQVYEGIIDAAGESVADVRCATAGCIAQISYSTDGYFLKAHYISCAPNAVPTTIPAVTTVSATYNYNPSSGIVDGYYDVCGLYNAADGYSYPYKFIYTFNDKTNQELWATRIACNLTADPAFEQSHQITDGYTVSQSAVYIKYDPALNYLPIAHMAYYATDGHGTWYIYWKAVYGNHLNYDLVAQKEIASVLFTAASDLTAIGISDSNYEQGGYKRSVCVMYGNYSNVDYPLVNPNICTIRWTTLVPTGGGTIYPISTQYRLTPLSKPYISNANGKIFQWLGDVFTNTAYLATLPEQGISGYEENIVLISSAAYHEAWCGKSRALTNVSAFGDSGSYLVPSDD